MRSVGAAMVVVAPSFRGFQKKVGDEVNKQMPRAGKQAGQQMTQGMATGMTQSLAPLQKAATRAGRVVETSAAKMAAANTRAANAAGAVRVAEARLAETMAAKTATTSRVVAAEEALAAARRRSTLAAQAASTAQGRHAAAVSASTAAHRALASAQAAQAATATATGTAAGTGFIARAMASLRAGAAGITGATRLAFAGAAGAGLAAGTAAGGGFVAGMARSLGPLAAIMAPAAILAGGMSRLSNIDDAKASLRGLGYEVAEIESILESANIAVTDTAYGLDAAASAATGAMGAGVQMGEELTSYLQLIGDMTQQSRTDFSSMANIINKVRGEGRLTGETLNQMTENGLYAASMLAEGFGVSQAELREMVSAGEVSAQDFERIMRDRIGGSALESGNTIRGAFANVRAALSRTGAAILGGEEGVGRLPGFLSKVRDQINEVNGRIAELWDWVGANREWLLPLAAGIGAVAAATLAWKVANLGLSVAISAVTAAMNMNPILRAIGLVVGLVTALVTAWKTSETFRDVVTNAWGAIQAAVAPVISWIVGTAVPWLQGAWDAIAGGVRAAWDWITGAFRSGKDSVSSVTGWFQSTLVPVFAGIWTAIQVGWAAIGAGISFVWESVIKPAWAAVAAGAQWLWSIIGPPITAIGSVFLNVASWIYDVVSNVLLLAWDLVAFGAQWLWNGVLKPVFENIGSAWTITVAAISFAWNGILKPVWDAIALAAGWLWNNVLKVVFATIAAGWNNLLLGFQIVWQGVLKPVWDAIALAAGWLWNTAIKPHFDAIKVGWQLMVAGITWVWDNTLKPLWNTVASFIEDTVLPGVRTGLDLLDNAWRGLANMFREPINWVINFVWNDGLKAAFDAVARAIGSEARLPAAPTIPAFAKGGLAAPGWALVGEEGPELVNFTSPGRVYTATETQQMLGRGAPAGMFTPTNPPHGAGFWDDVGATWSRTWRGAVDTVKAGATAAVDWVRGGLANAANLVLSPLFDGLGGLMSHWGTTGRIGADTMTNVKDRLVGWVRGHDEDAPDAPATGGGRLAGARPHVAANAQALANAVGGIRTMQAINQSMAGGHPRGLAVDFIDRIDKLNRLADVIVRTGGYERFNYMAWNRRLWSPGRGWRPQTRGYGNDPFHTWHLHAEWFDNGGMLYPGQLAYHSSSMTTPDRVLTDSQWDAMSTLAARGADGSERHVLLRVGDREFDAYMSEISDGRIERAAAASRRSARQLTGRG